MPGPPPKDPALRARANKKPSAATIEAAPIAGRPELPPKTAWHPLTVEFWKATWDSPMSKKFLPGDLPGLYVLVELVDQFWLAPNVDLAREIRQQRMAYGLTPLDRNRLDWKIEAPKPAETTAAPEVRARADFDPRKVLEMPAARGKR